MLDLVVRLCAGGLPGWRLVTSTDRAERLLLQAAGERADRLARQRMKEQAIEINNALVKAAEE